MIDSCHAPRARGASHRLLRVLAVMLTLALIVAACGSGRDSDKSGGSSDTTAAGGSDTTAEGDTAKPIIDTSECPEADPAIGITGDTIKFGTSLPESGLYSAFKEILRGENAYFKYMNDELGGVEVAGKKYKVELVAKDDAYDSAKTVTNADELINNDKVFGLFNVVGTKNNLAIRDTVNEDCVPNLFAATGSPVWGNPAYPWILGTMLVPYPLEMQAFVDYLKENKPAAKIAVLRANDDFGLSYVETLKALIKDTDLTIAKEETYDPEGADVAAQVTSLAATNADVFLLGATLLGCPTALNEMGSAGWKPLVYMSGTCTSKTLMAAAKANGDGVFSVAPLMDPSDPQYDVQRGDGAVQGEDRGRTATTRTRRTGSSRTGGRRRPCSRRR